MRPRDSRVHVSGEQLNDSIWHVVIEQGQARLLPPAARGHAGAQGTGGAANKLPGPPWLRAT